MSDSDRREVLTDPGRFLAERGTLHDARVEQLIWRPDLMEVHIVIDDLNSNYLDLPEYPGLEPATLILMDVQDLNVAVDQREPHLPIYEITAIEEDSRIHVEAKFWPSGRMNVICREIALTRGAKTSE